MGFRKLQRPANLLRSKYLNKVPQTASLPSLIKEEQNEQFRPIFRKELEKWGMLLRRFVDTNKSLIGDDIVLKEELSQKIGELLNEDQMKSLMERQGACFL